MTVPPATARSDISPRFDADRVCDALDHRPVEGRHETTGRALIDTLMAFATNADPNVWDSATQERRHMVRTTASMR